MTPRTFSIVAILFLMAVHGPVPARAADEADRKKLEGVWRGYVVEGKGDNPDRGPLKLEVVITGTKMSAINLQDGDKSLGDGTYAVDGTKAQGELDATGSVSGRRSQTYRGIFELNGDTLKWCVDNIGKGRPTEFVTRRGQYLLILKRQKS